MASATMSAGVPWYNVATGLTAPASFTESPTSSLYLAISEDASGESTVSPREAISCAMSQVVPHVWIVE